ncbi:MAG: CmcI family methyltransferase, partial [Planctomycetota bacterium]
EELKAYAPLVSKGSYCIVFDTIVEDVDGDMYPNRSWGPGNSPKSAVHEYLSTNPELSIQHHIDNKLLISVAPQGYLKRE